MLPDKDIDWQELEEAGFAILCLTLAEDGRAWKNFSWDLTNRWYERGWIQDPQNKNKSVVVTEEGALRAREFFAKRFAKKP